MVKILAPFLASVLVLGNVGVSSAATEEWVVNGGGTTGEEQIEKAKETAGCIWLIFYHCY